MKSIFSLFTFILIPLLSIAQICEGWVPGLGKPGLASLARTMAYDPFSDLLYVAGADRFGGDDELVQLAAYDGANWRFIGAFKCTSCGNGRIESLAIGDSGDVYIGGFFEGATGNNGAYVASQNVIRYSAQAQSFEPLGLGLEAANVYAVAYRNDSLFAAGRITQAKNVGGDLAVNNIALYDNVNQSWAALGQGIGSHNLSTDDNGDVHTLALGADGTVYAGGRFSKINGQDTVFSVAQWSPAQGWQSIGGGIFLAYNLQAQKYPGLVNHLAYNPNSQKLYAVGHLGYSIGGDNVLSAWNGSQWSEISGLGKPDNSGSMFVGYEMYVDTSENKVYVGGNFNSFNNPFRNPAGNYVAVYDELQEGFDNMRAGLTQTSIGQEVSAISKYKGEIFVSGNFSEADFKPANFLAAYNLGPTEFWHPVGHGAHGSCDEIYTMTVDTQTSEVVAGGKFEAMGGAYVTGIAAYSPGDGWHRYKGLELQRNGFSDPEVQDIFIGGGTSTPRVAVAAVFDTLYHHLPGGGGIFKNGGAGIVEYNAALGLWLTKIDQLGGNGVVHTVDLWKGQWIIGGNFTAVDGTPIQGLAFEDTANYTWQSFASIGGGQVQDIEVVNDSLVYIGGTFSTVNGMPIAGIAAWDGNTWSALGQNFGFQDDVLALAWDSVNQELIVGGQFEDVYQSDGTKLTSAGLAIWNGTSWSSRGSAGALFTSPSEYAPIVRSIEMAADGNFYIGGEFSSIDGVSADRVAHYIPSLGWQSLPQAGVASNACFLNQHPAVNALALSNTFNQLFLGGTFNRHGDGQGGKFAAYALGSLGNVAIIDRVRDVCPDANIVADPTFTNYNWSTGAPGNSIIVDGLSFTGLEKWVTVSAEKNGCLYRDSVLLKVGQNIFPTPDDPFMVVVDTQSLSVKTYLSKSYTFADTLIWDFGDGTIATYDTRMNLPDTFYHTYTNGGPQAITLTSLSKCADVENLTHIDLGTTGIAPHLRATFSLYPNPNNGQFSLRYMAQSPVIKLILTDLAGKKVWIKEVMNARSDDQYEIQLPSLPAGAYLLHLQDGGRRGSQMVVVK